LLLLHLATSDLQIYKIGVSPRSLRQFHTDVVVKDATDVGNLIALVIVTANRNLDMCKLRVRRKGRKRIDNMLVAKSLHSVEN